MQISIVDRNGCLNESSREVAERRLLFALSRFSSKIEQVCAVFSDTNGPRGGVDKSCRITVKLRRINDVTVTNVDSVVEACVARAADRIGRAVSRAIEKSRQFNDRQEVAS